MRKRFWILLVHLLWLNAATSYIAIADVEPALKKERHSPDGGLEVRTSLLQESDKDPYGGIYEISLVGNKGTLWSDKFTLRALRCSWSPDSRVVLLGLAKFERNMLLHYLRIGRERIQRGDLHLDDDLERRVELLLPEGAGGAYRSYVDFDNVVWFSNTVCRMLYIYKSFNKGGDADLEVDFSDVEPRLKIISVRSANGAAKNGGGGVQAPR